MGPDGRAANCAGEVRLPRAGIAAEDQGATVVQRIGDVQRERMSRGFCLTLSRPCGLVALERFLLEPARDAGAPPERPVSLFGGAVRAAVGVVVRRPVGVNALQELPVLLAVAVVPADIVRELRRIGPFALRLFLLLPLCQCCQPL